MRSKYQKNQTVVLLCLFIILVWGAGAQAAGGDDLASRVTEIENWLMDWEHTMGERMQGLDTEIDELSYRLKQAVDLLDKLTEERKLLLDKTAAEIAAVVRSLGEIGASLTYAAEGLEAMRTHVRIPKDSAILTPSVMYALENQPYTMTGSVRSFTIEPGARVGGVDYDDAILIYTDTNRHSITHWFNLDQRYDQFSALVATGDPATIGTELQLIGDEEIMFEAVYTPGSLPVPVSIDLTGVQVLQVTVTNTGIGHAYLALIDPHSN